jgi:Ni/Fe-hydrogenase subunit HybB-like protein
MVSETIFQHFIFREFILPFLLIFVIVFALLQKTKLLGDGKKQIDAIVAFVIGLIFVGVAYPKDVVNNMVLFLVVAIIVALVVLMLWGFISGSEMKEGILTNTAVKWIVGIVIFIAVIIALLWATGFEGTALDFLFRQSWSKTFWTNVAFVVVIGIVLAIVIKSGK